MKTIVFLFLTSLLLSAEGPGEKRLSKQQAAATKWKFFDGNYIQSTISDDGPYNDERRTGSSGMFWPKGTTKSAVFTSGLIIVGRHRSSTNLRSAAEYYQTEFQPGPINGTFNTTTNDPTVAADRNDTTYRIYKINKGDTELTNPDYADWPGHLGAPYIDVNNNGKWDKGTDKPKLYGDQTLWLVINDLDTAMHRIIGTTKPMGIEIHAMYYGFDRSGPLGNTMFMKWKIINKSDTHYDSTFVGLFSDVDMGDANDDEDGYDTTLSLAYVYNSDNDDAGAAGYGVNPPSVGTTFLGGKPAIGVYAYPVYIKSGPDVDDLPLGSITFPVRVFNYVRGLKQTGSPNINPITNQPSRFAFTGDPVTNTGWTRAASGIRPNDVRSFFSVGPFTLAPGDTQEVNAALVIAQDKDRLASVTLLRNHVQQIKKLYSTGLTNLATAASISSITNTTVDINLTVSLAGTNYTSCRAEVFSLNGDSIASFQLYDDGTHGDATANDHMYTNSFTTPAAPSPLYADIITANATESFRWSRLIGKIPRAKISIKGFTIFSDNMNGDGIANNGENIRYGLTINNPHDFSLSNVRVLQTQLLYPLVDAKTTTAKPYDPNNSATYISMDIPWNFPLTQWRQTFTIADENFNVWEDSIIIPVQLVQKQTAQVQRTAGKGSARFEIIITDPSKIKDHWYVLRGGDSLNGLWKPNFSLRDSTLGTELLNNISVDASSHTYPPTDGFKVIARSMATLPFASASGDAGSWFWPNAFYPGDYYSANGFGYLSNSTIHPGDNHNIEIPHAKRTGFTDLNSNGKIDQEEPYTFDTTDAAHTQRAYFFRRIAAPLQYTFEGFLPIPFTVIDKESTPERKLNVIIIDILKNNRWDGLLALGNTTTDMVYVMNDTYDNGTAYDASKGGQDIGPIFAAKGKLPFYFYMAESSPSKEYLGSQGIYTLSYRAPYSSRDIFTFNPTILTGISNNRDVPNSFALEQNFPNPFNPSTTIQYSIPVRTRVNLSIYNVLGQRVATLMNDIHDAGNYSVVWNGTDLTNRAVATGIYFYQIESGSFRSTKKMLLLK